MARAVGIDLGTTNSVVAVLEGGEPVVIPNAEGARTTPSVVGFSKNAEILVGEVAKRQAITNPDRTIRSVKRHMGDKSWAIELDGKKWTAQEISAQILMKLKRDAEAYLGDSVAQAVVTVPAYFDDAQRQATKEAGQIAGLEVLRIINEPTAASLAYGLDKEHDQTILVFDLGGGTFDGSVLELGDGVFEVKSTAGDNHLGGDNFDKAVVDWMVAEFKRDQGIDLSADKMALQRLYEAAEKAKIELSSTMTTQINLPFITATQDGPKHLDLQLTRAKLEEITADLLERTVGPTKQALKDAELDSSKIDHVVLVGGMTRMPAVQGESGMATYNKTLGKFQLVGIPPAPRGLPQVEVTFDIDANGIINVSAKDLGTGNVQQIQIQGGSGLSEDEVRSMIQNAESHADEARRLREVVDAKNLAETLAYQTERSLKEHRDKLDEPEASTIEGRIMELRQALEGDDVADIKAKTEALQEASHKLAEAVYAQATAQAQATGGGNGATTADDEVVEEGEYEVVDEEAKTS